MSDHNRRHRSYTERERKAIEYANNERNLRVLIGYGKSLRTRAAEAYGANSETVKQLDADMAKLHQALYQYFDTE